MKDDSSQRLNRPFNDLATLLKQRNIALAPENQPAPDSTTPPLSALQEAELFRKAMSDVTPLAACSRPIKKIRPRPSHRMQLPHCDDQDTLNALQDLIRHGDGFIVSQTPEYMECANPGACREVLRRLHAGRYAIQDHVDLHGLSVAEAAPVMERFIRRSVERGLRAVLVVHGRGLTSPGKPVLKQKVLHWVTRGRLRKWVIALTSARSCDGGAGATYLLLRRRPMTNSQQKNAHRKLSVDNTHKNL